MKVQSRYFSLFFHPCFFVFLFISLSSLVSPLKAKEPKIFFRKVVPQLVWNDQGSGGNQDVAFYRPLGLEKGWHSLGDMAFPTYSPPYEAGMIFFTHQRGIFAPPLSFTKVWDDRGSGANQDGSLWKLNCPEGFVALGYVANRGYTPPALDSAACLHHSLTLPVPWTLGHANASGDPHLLRQAKQVWTDQGSGAKADCAVFKIREGQKQDGVYLSTFKAHSHHDIGATLPGPHYQLTEAFYALLEEASPASTELLCQGSRALCHRPYNQVATLTSHNAFANQKDGFAFPNQKYNLTQQLKEGVRGLMLDTHTSSNRSYLCHGSCFIGKRLLVDGLKEIAYFLEAHPGEVVTLIFEDNISGAETTKALVASGLMPFTYLHHPDDSARGWPTLKEMIESNQRLVVFTDERENASPWNLYVWTYASETNYSYKKKEDMTCAKRRGNGRDLFIFNHFLTNPYATEGLAKKVNYNPFMEGRAHQCQQEWGQIPNFVTVDFYHLGNAKSVVAELNR